MFSFYKAVAVQFGHLFAKGDTREAAIRAMVVALKEVKIRGEIRTTIDYCVEMIQSPDFVGNAIHTGWLDSRIASHVRCQSFPPTCRRGSARICWNSASRRRAVQLLRREPCLPY